MVGISKEAIQKGAAKKHFQKNLIKLYRLTKEETKKCLKD
jgi:hypothetical protein